MAMFPVTFGIFASANDNPSSTDMDIFQQFLVSTTNPSDLHSFNLSIGPSMLSVSEGFNPTAVTTAVFPDHRRPQQQTCKRQRVSRARKDTQQCCSICLENIASATAVQLPCMHSLHRLCICALHGNTVMGARSMVRCPNCRYELDRYDLLRMGYRAHPRQLAVIALRCQSIRLLASGAVADTGVYHMERIGRLIMRCRDTDASDGLIYNVALLSLERSLHHRKQFMWSISYQVDNTKPPTEEEYVNIQVALECHIEVLIKSANSMNETAF